MSVTQENGSKSQISDKQKKTVQVTTLTSNSRPILRIQRRINLIKKIKRRRIALLYRKDQRECNQRFLTPTKLRHPQPFIRPRIERNLDRDTRVRLDRAGILGGRFAFAFGEGFGFGFGAAFAFAFGGGFVVFFVAEGDFLGVLGIDALFE